MIKEDKSLNQELVASSIKIAIVGGSNSVMRNGYTKHLKDYLAQKTNKEIKLSYFALGAVNSVYGVIQNIRYNIPQNHDLILFEYCINDRNALKK